MPRKILFEGKHLRLISEKTWEYVERIRGTGIVVILAMTSDQKVILIDQYRPAVKKKVIEFPAGLVNDMDMDAQETMEEAAKRELFEETGYEAKKIVPVIKGPHASGASSAIISFYRALNIKKSGKGGGDALENITVYEIPLKRVDSWLGKMEKKGFTVDPKVYAGLYFLMHHPKRGG